MYSLNMVYGRIKQFIVLICISLVPAICDWFIYIAVTLLYISYVVAIHNRLTVKIFFESLVFLDTACWINNYSILKICECNLCIQPLTYASVRMSGRHVCWVTGLRINAKTRNLWSQKIASFRNTGPQRQLHTLNVAYSITVCYAGDLRIEGVIWSLYNVWSLYQWPYSLLRRPESGLIYTSTRSFMDVSGNDIDTVRALYPTEPVEPQGQN